MFESMKERYKWLISAGINILFLLLSIFIVGTNYETSDDFVIAERIVAGYPFVGYVDYNLCRFMISLQKIFAGVNVYIALQIIASCLALIVLTKIFMDRVQDKVLCLIYVIVLGFYSADFYSLLQFTKTAGLLAAIGLIVVTDSIAFKRGIGYFILGGLIFLVAAAFRFEMVIFAVGYAGLYLLFWLFENRKNLIKDGYFKWPRIVCYVTALCILAGSGAMFIVSEKENNSTEELKEYHDYNYYRYSYVDYSVYDDYKKDPDAYDSTGLSANDFYLMRKWYFDYDGAASYDNLKAVKEVFDGRKGKEARPPLTILKKTVREVGSKMIKHSVIGCHLLILFFLALYALLKGKLKSLPYVLALGISTFTLYYALNFMGRSIYRVLFIIDIAATMWLIYSIAAKSSEKGSGEDERQSEQGAADMVIKGISVVLLVAVLAASGLGMQSVNEKSKSKHASIKVNSHDMEELLENDKEHAYVFSTLDKCYDRSYLQPLKAPRPFYNVFTFGAWGTKSPYLMDKMKNAGLDNVFGDIIDNEKVYVIDNSNAKHMEEYLNKWYGGRYKNKKIVYKKIDDISGNKVWKVVTE